MKNVIFCAVYKTKEVLGTFYNLPEKMNYLILSRNLWRCIGAFIVNFEQISYIALVFPLLILKKKCRLASTNLYRNMHLFQNAVNFLYVTFP